MRFTKLIKTDEVEVKYLHKGQRIIYEGEEAKIISVKPLLIVKTKNGVVCGNIQKRAERIRK